MLDELKRLMGEATPGPWGNMDEDECEPQPCVATYHNDVRFDGFAHYACGPDAKTVAQAQADARLIAAAVNALPKLLAVCEAARDARDVWYAMDRERSIDAPEREEMYALCRALDRLKEVPRALVERVREARERDGSELSVAKYIGGGDYMAEDTGYGEACEALADYLLAHPEAFEPVEVLREWGRAKVNAIDTGSALFRAEHAYEYDGGPREAWEQAGNAHLVARAAETRAGSVASGEWEADKIAQARASALREAADMARAHGGISAYYAILKLAAEVAPAAEVSDG